MQRKKIKAFTQQQLIAATSLLLVLFYNYSFFKNLFSVYPPNKEYIGFLFSLTVVFYALTVILFNLLSSKWTLKPLLIVVLLISSMTAYFMDTYHVVIDESMIRNAFQTDIDESIDLLSFKQLLYLLFLGLLPAYRIYKTPLHSRGLKKELLAKLKTVILALAVILLMAIPFGKHYASFLREHKPLRYSVNPLYWIYSIGKYSYDTFGKDDGKIEPIGVDATIPDSESKKLMVFVVGEAARADHFGLNGYKRETNPLLKQEQNLISFPDFYACGTSTAHSVPCMFSPLDRASYSDSKAAGMENVLDILKHTGKVSLLWRENNSDSKGVALRIPYQWYKSPQINTVCSEGECRDIGMLKGLNDFIAKNRGKHIMIILHQMGNHGPAYYKRYPKAFEKFTPVCKTNQLEACTQEEIANAYDNALLYTDYFLDQTIRWLKKYQDRYQTAMFYVADHGESLGEKGLYLHGMPYFMAPDAQKHVGALLWLGSDADNQKYLHLLREKAGKHYSHDNLFHTILGFFNAKTKLYNPKQDILHAP